MVWVTAKVVDGRSKMLDKKACTIMEETFQPDHFGDLKVPVIAPQYYYRKDYREDGYSARV
ncbi:MAG: hypothetical protein AABX40_08185, partial [Candidatus Hydrothermarchaeota archaeon]